MIGIGVDIVSIARMKETINRSGDIFLKRVFTEKEIENSLDHYNRDVYYSEIFAGKEAVFKSFCVKGDHRIEWQDIEILHGECGAPAVALKRYLRQLFDEKNGRKILLSLSWEPDTVIAFAALI
ncbi:holo-ACP synthase [Geosporobacter ferrireducens]|uniref:Holo-[acyl-carrier-protein] synthase n=1 Tax=Geosporobacter ferrireducens TaxID=1424294 RepID=A0A1D8GF76_9FIRM|nr:holo-ACP synthase [Geosporobacter ferrireducens]AOT69566.1 holo-[acyl-carrier-protein] synthase [Geosporobacter ferrireducens]